MTEHAVRILYTNYRGVTESRVIVPRKLYWGMTEHHPTEQWLLEAICLSRKALRTFAMKDVRLWEYQQADMGVKPPLEFVLWIAADSRSALYDCLERVDETVGTGAAVCRFDGPRYSYQFATTGGSLDAAVPEARHEQPAPPPGSGEDPLRVVAAGP